MPKDGTPLPARPHQLKLARIFTKDAFHFCQHKTTPTGKLWVYAILGAHDLFCVRFGCLLGGGAYNGCGP